MRFARGDLPIAALGLVSLLGVSLPNFALGPLLILLFSIGLGLLPVSGRDGISHLILPAVTLGMGIAAMTMRMVRSSMLEEIHQDYVRTARAKGLRERTVLFKHALRNGLIPVITILGLQTGVAACRCVHYGNDLFLAGAGPIDDTGHQRQGLSAGAGLHPHDFTDLHSREPPHRRDVFRGRSPHPAMKKLFSEQQTGLCRISHCRPSGVLRRCWRRG